MIDAINGWALVDKTLEAVRNLIVNMVANSQQFGTRLDLISEHVDEVNVFSLEKWITSLISLVCQMAVGNIQTMKVYGICLLKGFPTDMCPTFQDELIEQMNAAFGFPEQP